MVDRAAIYPRTTITQPIPNPEGVASIPNVPFVVRNVVAFEQRAKLVLKRRSAMMLLLVSNVAADPSDLRVGCAANPRLNDETPSA
jgi:hypothetical protein